METSIHESLLMTRTKKPYIAPQLKKYSTSSLPGRLQEVVADLLTPNQFKVVVDQERRYRSVPSEFAALLGYAVEELTGKRVDDITVPNSVDIELVFQACLKLGEMDGLWLFEHREGKKLLFHYRARRERELLCAELHQMGLAS